MSLRFTATSAGVHARVGRQELAVLEAIPGFLSSVGADDDDDPATERLFPVAYDDDAAAAEFRRFARPEIERARELDRDVLSDVLDRLSDGEVEMTTEEAESCMRTVGAARIAIAARHDLFDAERFEAESRSPHGTIVAFLGIVQDEMVAALNDAAEVGHG